MSRHLWILIAVMGYGCAYTSAGLAPSDRPLGSGHQELGPTSGRDCMYYLMGILPVSSPNTTSTARDQAIRAVPGANALVQVTVTNIWQWLLIVTRNCVEVEGIAAKIFDGTATKRPAKAAQQEDPCRFECAQLGLCKHQGGKCLASSAADCQASAECARAGLCSLRGEKCVAADDADCTAAQVCEQSQQCYAVRGICSSSNRRPIVPTNPGGQP